MSRWPNAFFFAASLCILVGANWGLYMSITDDFSTAPAHAHLNLLGWVSLSIMGSFYALLGKDTPLWLVRTNFFLSCTGVTCMITGLGLLFTNVATVKQLLPLIAVGELSVIAGFVSFAAAVFLSLKLVGARRPPRPAAA